MKMWGLLWQRLVKKVTLFFCKNNERRRTKWHKSAIEK
ncbi:hypothetical protein CLOBOL_03079 [Enterocloster bolteae ATCC BAA-613]|uniref:Uncharacterized protein n=1 Tax=Enterocloster bolteae (strain ATCC BAA-613 / DSM 15670 / CCUG 46953 / JCM 12243 / WAL 16351) TaxID=411902 RepID=A8RRS3_ENTBW|nr:hypothetical protein CLOBOL_03079 [Enterocloster bolteae ATCC BAA-613]